MQEIIAHRVDPRVLVIGGKSNIFIQLTQQLSGLLT